MQSLVELLCCCGAPIDASMNVDGYRLSGYLYKDRSQKLVMAV